MQKITTIWPDGSLIAGESWRDVEEQLRARQWQKYSVGQLRREMRRRAEVWSGEGTEVRVSSAEAMFRDLEASGMIRIEIEEGGDDDGRRSGRSQTDRTDA